MKNMRFRSYALFAMTMILASMSASAHAESIKVGLSRLLGYPAVPIGIERGYFKDIASSYKANSSVLIKIERSRHAGFDSWSLETSFGKNKNLRTNGNTEFC